MEEMVELLMEASPPVLLILTLPGLRGGVVGEAGRLESGGRGARNWGGFSPL